MRTAAWKRFGETKQEAEKYLRDFAYEDAFRFGEVWFQLSPQYSNNAVGFLFDQLDEARSRPQVDAEKIGSVLEWLREIPQHDHIETGSDCYLINKRPEGYEQACETLEEVLESLTETDSEPAQNRTEGCTKGNFEGGAAR